MVVPHGLKAIKVYYGNPSRGGRLDPAFERKLVRVKLPYRMYYLGEPVRYVKSHARAAGALLGALTKVLQVARGRIKERDGYNRSTAYYDKAVRELLHENHLDLYGGMFCFRPKRRNSKQLSPHAWGIAIDIDPEHNPQGREPVMPRWFVECWESYGWVWGGTFRRASVDGMHFQLCSGY